MTSIDTVSGSAEEQRLRPLLAAVRSMVASDAVAVLRLQGQVLVPVAVDGLSDEALGRGFPLAAHPRLAQLLASEVGLRFAADSGLPDPYDGLVEGQRELLLPRTILHALRRFGATRDLQDVATTTHRLVQSEADRLDSELSMIRFIVWAIPAIGFVGTVRGIGIALRMAHRAVEGDVTAVTQFLGSAFNATLVALLTCITLMFLVHQLQLIQERLAFDAEAYAEEHLLRHLYVS